MPNPTWPGGLPQSPLLAATKEALADNVVRSPMDTGPAKVRRRATAGVRKMTLESLMTTAQVATLDTFFTTTLLDGSLPFDWTSPRTGATVTFMFTGPPDWGTAGAQWRVNLPLEIRP
jgi:hypothetical protein